LRSSRVNKPNNPDILNMTTRSVMPSLYWNCQKKIVRLNSWQIEFKQIEFFAMYCRLVPPNRCRVCINQARFAWHETRWEYI
jgi:hypothetical protein